MWTTDYDEYDAPRPRMTQAQVKAMRDRYDAEQERSWRQAWNSEDTPTWNPQTECYD